MADSTDGRERGITISGKLTRMTEPTITVMTMSQAALPRHTTLPKHPVTNVNTQTEANGKDG